MKIEKFIPTKCGHCGQTEEYKVSLSKGLAIVLAKIYNFIQAKKINVVHPRKEMEKKQLSSNDVGNISHLIYHGMLKDLEEPGNVALTKKGLDFIKNDLEVEKIVIVSKVHDKAVYYYRLGGKTNFRKLIKDKVYWEGDFITRGNIIKK